MDESGWPDRSALPNQVKEIEAELVAWWLRVRADKAVHKDWIESSDTEFVDALDLEDPRHDPLARIFFTELSRRYSGEDKCPTGFQCFLTGNFEFGEIHKTGSSVFEVSNLRFSRTDIQRCFGTGTEAAPASAKGAGGRPPKWPWIDALVHLVALAEGCGLGQTKRVAAREVTDHLVRWFSQNSDDGNHPDMSDIRRLSRKIINQINNLENGGN